MEGCSPSSDEQRQRPGMGGTEQAEDKPLRDPVDRPGKQKRHGGGEEDMGALEGDRGQPR